MAAPRRLIRCGVLIAFCGAPLGACEAARDPGPAASAPASEQGERVKVGVKGETFRLELALDDATRFKGLGGRTEIAKDGGMLFVFPYAAKQAFVMRDCPIAIDIAYLDSAGRVVMMHEMKPEEPRRAGESDYEYDLRLKKYESRHPAQFVVEVAGGRFREVGLEVGDVLKFDVQGLKARAR
ncbi:MAG: DUF192 domain-containing protein [Phycisphaerales bacterium]|nr:DUF192 domain-containing protein [Phycisphaerales bacterium]